MTEDKSRAELLIMTVGSSRQPLVVTINKRKPRFIIYVPSSTTRGEIPLIEREVEWTDHEDRETIQISDPDDMNKCLFEIRKGLRKFMVDKNLPLNSRIIADFTGGTKAMSCALALAMNDFNSSFSYVGGTERDPEKRNTVKPGHEIVYDLANPWSDMGIQPIRRLVYAFEHNQFQAALNEAERISRRQKGNEEFYKAIEDVIRAYMLWDLFAYKEALLSFDKGMSPLKHYSASMKNFGKIFPGLKRDHEILKQVKFESELFSKAKCPVTPKELKEITWPLPEDSGSVYLRDLMANVLRCANDGHYDDAVARLYSITEKVAKISLGKEGINNNNVPQKTIDAASQEFKNLYASKLKPDKKNRIAIPLQASFALLLELKPETKVAQKFMELKDDFDKALEPRNNSLLAHGYQPIGKDKYENLKKLVLELLAEMDVREEEIPKFATFTLDALLCEPESETAQQTI